MRTAGNRSHIRADCQPQGISGLEGKTYAHPPVPPSRSLFQLRSQSSSCFLRLSGRPLRGPATFHSFRELLTARCAQSCLFGCSLFGRSLFGCSLPGRSFLRLHPGTFRSPSPFHRKRQPPPAFRSHAAFACWCSLTAGLRRCDTSGRGKILQGLERPVDSRFLIFEPADDIRYLVQCYSPLVTNLRKA